MSTSNIQEIKIELIRQWVSNHAEHCGHGIYPCHNPDGCQWPMPRAIPPNEAYSLLSQVLGETP